jgi:hypothetical protein
MSKPIFMENVITKAMKKEEEKREEVSRRSFLVDMGKTIFYSGLSASILPTLFSIGCSESENDKEITNILKGECKVSRTCEHLFVCGNFSCTSTITCDTFDCSADLSAYSCSKFTDSDCKKKFTHKGGAFS